MQGEEDGTTFLPSALSFSKKNTYNWSGSEWEVDDCCLILVPAATPEVLSCTGVNKDKLLCTSERSVSAIWGRENHRRAWNEKACKRKAYLISTGRHKALFLMQLSALIRFSVEHQLKHIFITQHWCKRILDHWLSHGGVRLEYRTLSSERRWFGTVRPQAH